MREFKSRKKTEEPEVKTDSKSDITSTIKNFFSDHQKRVLIATGTFTAVFILSFGSLAYHFLGAARMADSIQQEEQVAEVETEAEEEIIKITSDDGLTIPDESVAATEAAESGNESEASEAVNEIVAATIAQNHTTYVDKSSKRETAAPDESIYESHGDVATQIETKVNGNVNSEDLSNAKLDLHSEDSSTTKTYLLIDDKSGTDSNTSDGSVDDSSDNTTTSSEESVSSENKETTSESSSSDKVSTVSLPLSKKKLTVLVYVVGSSLETKSNLAANSIVTMLTANVDTEDVNIVIETGGTKDFHNISTADQKFDESKIERWMIDGTRLLYLGEGGNSAELSMTDEGTFESYLKYVKENFPASRYEAVLWGQSGGPLNGFGYDEINGAGGQLTLSDMSTALGNADMNLDLLLFDARLMGAMETGYALASHVDYMIASEDNEYSIGLNYTNWLKGLSSDPDQSVKEQGQQIIDDFISTNKGKGEGKDEMIGAYSMIDLKALKRNTAEKLKTLAELLKEAEKTEDGRDHLRQSSKEAYCFAKGYSYDLIDVCSFLEAIESNYTGSGKEGIDYAEIRRAASALKSSIEDTISVSRYVTPKDDGGIYGLTIYFPQTNTEAEKKKSMVSKYENLSFSSSYQQLVKQYTE
ncbi:MAG: hypothetical protein K5900_06750 [Butyrivibrio sp.]|nr:hypothetical protein [Butyrivibrio sp.]